MTEKTKQDLLHACAVIGGVSSYNYIAFIGLSDLVEQTGKPINELSVGEFCGLIDRHEELYNQTHQEISND